MRAHDNAILALLRADTVLATRTFEGVVTNRPDAYVTVFARDAREAERFTGPQATVHSEYIIHSVAKTPDGAKQYRDRAYEQLLGVTPTIAGWSCRRIRFVSSRPMAYDADVDPPLYYFVDVIAFSAERV